MRPLFFSGFQHAFVLALLVLGLNLGLVVSAEAQEKKGVVPVWGPESNGVRASLNVVSKPLSIIYPNEVGIFVVLENLSDEPVSYVIADNGKGMNLVVRWAGVFEKKADLFSRYKVKPGATIMKSRERRVIGCTMAFVKGRQLADLNGKEVRGVFHFIKASSDQKSLKKFKVKTNTVRFQYPLRPGK